MKVCYALPVLAQSAVNPDDTTLLSLNRVRMQDSATMLEAGVSVFLDAVGNRNVTHMSSLLQNLVEETINDGPEGSYYELDGDVTAALEIIKQELLKDIRSALNEAHCSDQVDLHKAILCFETCEKHKEDGAASCPQYCDGSMHKQCRDGLLIRYKKHIDECRALDDFMKAFDEEECPVAPKKCCLLSHTTWNCDSLCADAIAQTSVDGDFGAWLNSQITKFENAYTEWTALHHKCNEAFKAYVEEDARCDCMQADCEQNNCRFETCHYLNCEDNYNACWGKCEAEFEQTNKVKECLEKDRKIDWSASEKIECYVDVLLAKPTKEELLSKCGTEDCYNKYREIQYKECNLLCPEVDFETVWGEHLRREDDQDVTGEGEAYVRTRHRAADGSDADVRCTAHLDLDYQVPPCCHPCEVRPEPPCTDAEGFGKEVTYKWLHYGQHGHFDTSDIAGFAADVCHSGEHTYAYAYNLCPCEDCPRMPDCSPPTCTGDKRCSAGPYNYRVHDIVANLTCSEHVTKPEPLPTVMPATCMNGEVMTTAPALSGGCQRCTCAGGQWQCSCSLRHRKEIHDLTDEEFSKFAAALNALKADGTWANISMVHRMGDSHQRHPAGQSHRSPVFLPWHRKFMIEVENRLQMAVDDCSVTLPYWNWALELADFENSDVFSSNRMGALKPDAHDQCVTDGAFGTKTPGSSFGFGPNELGWFHSSGSDCIMRGGRKPWMGQSYATILSQLSERYMGTDEFVPMSTYIESNIHNGFHSAIGGWGKRDAMGNWARGHMSGMNSPYDPLFFLHHGFMDLLWSKWQDVHIDESNRLHRQNDEMYELLWDGTADVFPVSDVAWNMDILDDRSDTEDIQEKACVVYHERHNGDMVCAAEWHHIQHCMSKVAKAQRLHEVPRIREMLEGEDVCSPVNGNHPEFDENWLDTLKEMGMIDHKDVREIMQWEADLNAKIEERTPILDSSAATECDKKLCFSTKTLFQICDEIEG